ncbi:MAG: thermonuclease family protein, partial [Ilumatobacteraceae bacterium]
MPVRRAADPPAGSSMGSAIAVIALAAMALTGCGALRAGDVGPVSRPVDMVMAPNALVVGVVDGDTIDVDVDGRRERVRLIGIDTPETLKPDTPVECYGPEATARAADLL